MKKASHRCGSPFLLLELTGLVPTNSDLDDPANGADNLRFGTALALTPDPDTGTGEWPTQLSEHQREHATHVRHHERERRVLLGTR